MCCGRERHGLRNGLGAAGEAVGLRLHRLGDVVGCGDEQPRCLGSGGDDG